LVHRSTSNLMYAGYAAVVFMSARPVNFDVHTPNRKKQFVELAQILLHPASRKNSSMI
jgi:hypothetical protein